MTKYILLVFLFCLGCNIKNAPEPTLTHQDVGKILNQMTDVMVHDVTNPPLAARFFAYTCLAGYEVATQNDASLKPMRGVLNDYPTIEKAVVAGRFSPHLASVLAMYETAKKMQPSGKILDDFEIKFMDSCTAIGFPKTLIDNSLAYAKTVSSQILAYAKADKYNRISNFVRYTPSNTEGGWYPTPPGYMAAVEPYFNTVRPFTLDSAPQFKPTPPIPFSKVKNSTFYRLMNAVYAESLTPEKKEIAAFWDCNPFALQDNGHLLVGMKKISPGAHWVGITGIACTQKQLSFNKTLHAQAVVTLGLMDAFICCWDEKYRSNRIRPETAIRKYLDPNWKPMLQTPPFPEYLSGHSTISATSATLLSALFGDNFSYSDTVEERFGLAPRTYTSFNEAASEAGISRFYGGIHFMDAIENGQKQGALIGQNIIEKLGL